MTETLDDFLETIEFPDTDGFEDGDTFIDASTGRVYVLARGNWYIAGTQIRDDTYSSVARSIPWVLDNLVLAGLKL